MIPEIRKITKYITSIMIPLLKDKWIPSSLFISFNILLSLNIEKSKYGRKVYSIKFIFIPKNTWDANNPNERIKIDIVETNTWFLNLADKKRIKDGINISGIQLTK